MAAQREQKFTPLETETDDFEDVALLVDPDQEQPQSSRRPLSWKDKLLEYFAWGGARSHTGFEKLDQLDTGDVASGRTQGTGFWLAKTLHGIICCATALLACTEAVFAALLA